jgi:hypothetical protein
MRAFLATVLSVIAVGVLLIAYGLLAPRASAQAGMAGAPAMSVVYDPQTGTYQLARPVYAGDRMALPESGYGYPQAAPGRFVATPVGYSTPAVYTTPVDYPGFQAPAPQTARPVRTAPRSVASVERPQGRNWKKTALVIGGSTATGAGIGALVGGKKGALIGAAIGGGASTLYESRK